VNDEDEATLNNFFPGMVFSVPEFEAASELLDRRGKEVFFESALMSIIRSDVSRVLDPENLNPILWNSMSQRHIALFAANLPEDSQAAAFCRLCLGRKPMGLSDDPSKIAAFFSSRPVKDVLETAALSLFLMTWPDVSVEFLLRLFERSLEGHERMDEWATIPKIVSKIWSLESRKAVARGIALILKRRYGNRMDAGLRSAVGALGVLEKSGRLPENYGDEPDGFGFDEKIVFKMLKRMFEKAGKGSRF
jgi:hypothetical protein